MDMTSQATLIQQLVDAQRSGTRPVDATAYSTLDRETAYTIQHGVMVALGEKPGMYKTAVAPDGLGVVAPIFASRVGQSGALKLPLANIIGLEVEVGVVLAKDVPNDTGDIDLVEAIDHYFVGMEVCGSRFVDRSLAGFNGGLADSTSAYGYVINPVEREPGADLDNFDVTLEFGGKQICSAPAKHGFGSVLASLVAYAKAQRPEYPLKAGMIITTGSLCGLVPTSGTGHAVATLGSHKVECDIV
jgi:2-keto-4-pentenoate hydratase